MFNPIGIHPGLIIMCDVGLLTAVYHWHIMASGAIYLTSPLVLALWGPAYIMTPLDNVGFRGFVHAAR